MMFLEGLAESFVSVFHFFLIFLFLKHFSFGFLPFVFSLKFTYIIVIAVQGILMGTVNFFKPQIERK